MECNEAWVRSPESVKFSKAEFECMLLKLVVTRTFQDESTLSNAGTTHEDSESHFSRALNGPPVRRDSES